MSRSMPIGIAAAAPLVDDGYTERVRGADHDPRAPRGPVLVADDDARIRRLLRVALERAGYEVWEAENGAVAQRLVAARLPHLVVLDVVMPFVSGLELLRRWRSQRLDIAVIVLTGYADEDSVGDALAAGADDHIAKPFQVRELVERVNAVLRRTQRSPSSSAERVVGDVRVDLVRQRAVVGERVVLLSKTELAILWELMGSPGRVVSANELLTKVWGPEYRGDAEIVRTNVYRLRRKLNAGEFLQSRHGIGYFVPGPGDPNLS
jgi:DNA-binding response OmpR family regulator